MVVDAAVLGWLLDQDPALRWQVERDLAGAPEDVWRATRARVAHEGFGARLLALQDPDGQWAGGAFFPRDFPFERMEDEGQPWTATSWSLSALREWGVEASVLAGTAERLAEGSRWEYDDLPYWGGEVDVCINAATLANGAWLGADVSALAGWFVEHAQPEGGWNCAWVEGSRRSSFHSTLNAVKGLLAYEAATGGTGGTGGTDQLRAARHAGEEYLLQRRLLQRRSTGELVGPWATRFAYPFRWAYSALHALDHLRAAALHDGVPPDPRLAEAVAVVRAGRRPDGTWTQEGRHPGRVWFEVDVPAGERSPWLTFLALRTLSWWEGTGPGAS
ncbi:squalene cyclase [Cellulomonas endophytica]|uniref:squalene cyclase n=1 Tax=Cellulomonas endophytica TaxID=2494735 RepID=UPI001011F2E2|nr:squalene cyclase [Cellulomonas endophytica]